MKKILFILLIFSTTKTDIFTQEIGEWKTIYTFSGSSNESTDDFVIKADKWRIVWEARKQYENIEGGNVFIKLVDMNGDETLIANAIPYDSGKTIIRKKGTFYFEIYCLLARWKIEVQVYVSKKTKK